MWDAAKAVIRGNIISYTSARKRATKKCMMGLMSELSKFGQLHKQHPSEDNFKKLHDIRNKLNILQTEQTKKLLSFTKQKYFEFGNKPSRLLAHQLKKEHAERIIKVIRNSNGQLTYDTKLINQAFAEFYDKLYYSENPSDSNIQTFLDSISLPSLAEEDRAYLDALPTSLEVQKTIKSLASGKTPGLDGFPSEFYKAFFMPMVNDFFENGNLPEEMKTAIITLIHKIDKDATECMSYRPISLLPVDLKIISKLLASRLEKILPNLIHSDQTGFVKARYGSDNIRRLLNIIDYSKCNNLKTLTVSLDAEKAFDRIEWIFLFAALKKFNLSDKFIFLIKNLYSNPLAKICTNNLMSEEIVLKKGCRQGCPFSPLLFNLAIEPLAEAIRSRHDVSGVCIANTVHKISLYADDILLYLTKPDQSIPATLSIINDFGNISGYKINYTKSNACLLSSSISENLCSISPFTWSQMGFKYLGVVITSNLKDLYSNNYLPLNKK